MSENTEYRYASWPTVRSSARSSRRSSRWHIRAKDDSFSYKGVTYDRDRGGPDSLYSVSSGGRLLAIAYKDIVSSTRPQPEVRLQLQLQRPQGAR